MEKKNNVPLCVALPESRNAQQHPESGATHPTTEPQRMSLKALAYAVLNGNPIRNNRATNLTENAQLAGENVAAPVARPEPDFKPLSDRELASLVTNVAHTYRVEPITVWRWLCADDIAAIRSGDPVELRAFAGCVGSAVACGMLRPEGGHQLPFPGTRATTPGRYEIQQGEG
jgi:hypothetical protein